MDRLVQAGCLAVTVMLGAVGSQAAMAAGQDTTGMAPAGTGAGGPFGFLANTEKSAALLGPMWGVRPWLSQYGVTLNILETSEVLGNVTGGFRRGFEYDGLTTVDVQLDTMRAFGLYGGTFNVSGLQYHGRNLSADNLGTLQTASGIEAERATRLWELWYDQKFLEEDRLDVKIGQQSLDQEFMVSSNALLFVNTMFGWPMVPSADMPGGGPAYPLSAPGLRLRVRPNDSLTFLAGVFNGSPALSNNGDSQQLNRTGTSFPLNGGALAIAEMQYAFPPTGAMTAPGERAPLQGVYKLGVWYDTEQFPDQRFDNTGLSLANPVTTGIPKMHRGNWSIYGVADQMVWQDPDDDGHNVYLFARAMGTPQTDRNLIDFSLNLGLTVHTPFPKRSADTFGVGLGVAHVSPRAAALDRDTEIFTGAFTPPQGTETFVEVTYSYAVAPWLSVQPDFQYVFNPGGGIPNLAGTAKVKDEAVFGVRANILF